MAAYTAILFIPIAIFKTTIGIVARYNKEVLMLNTKIEYFRMIGDLEGLSEDPGNSIELFFDNDSLQIERNKIMLITAWGNYIKVMVQTNNKPVEVVKRGRIKEIEDQLISYPEFIRCHRSYILNLNFIKSIIGNAKKSDAILKDKDTRIPIARGNIKIIRESLEKQRLRA
jgi:DNA-binding LytR/AlgR family response regulator